LSKGIFAEEGTRGVLGTFERSDTETEFPGIWTYLRRDVDISVFGLSYGRSNNEFCAEEVQNPIFDPLPLNEKLCSNQ